MTAANILLALLLLQYPYPSRRVPRQQGGAPGSADTEAVASFTGTFKFADKKFVTIATEEGETMRMYLTGSTKFIRDGKPAHASDFKEDEPVTVEASRDARLNLIARRVENAKAEAKPN